MIVSRDVLGFSVTPNMTRVMEVNGMHAAIMRADKKKETDSQGLPSGIPIPVIPVDFLKDRPDFWVGGQGSYVCPIESDWGLWFNWSMNNNDVSILTSVKGMNPLTGQRISGLGLEQYYDRCPIHDVEFKHDRLCPECNFKWPDQNYISSPNSFYLDGFRTSDGVVRQFFFTEDMAKSVPEQVIGKDDTVPAFGFCFFKLKDCKTDYEGGNRYKNELPEQYQRHRHSEPRMRGIRSLGVKGMKLGSAGSERVYGSSIPMRELPKKTFSSYKYKTTSHISDGEPIRMSDDSVKNVFYSATADSASLGIGSDSPSKGFEISAHNAAASLFESDYESSTERFRSADAEVGVGAGAKIKQSLSRDSRPVEVWQDKPAGVMRIYFVFREQFERYAAAGMNDLSGTTEGYLDGVSVGGAK